MKKLERGCYLQLEGMDGCGKTTQAKLLAEYCQANGLDYIHIRQPGSTPVAEAVRAVVLNNKATTLKTEFMMMLTCWVETHFQVVLPALMANKIVISERGFGSLYAYQLYGRNLIQQLDTETIGMLISQLASFEEYHSSVANPFGEYYIYLKQPKERSLANIQKRLGMTGEKEDRFERETLDFFERVIMGYDVYDESDNPLYGLGSDFHRVEIDISDKGIPEVHQALLDILRNVDSTEK